MLADNILGLKLGSFLEAYAQGPLAIAALVLIVLTFFTLRLMR